MKDVSFDVTTSTVSRLIKRVGELMADNAALFTSGPQGIFATGAVSLTFDDGWLSQYQHAVPKMNAAGLKATFYLLSKRFSDDGFPAYMSRAQTTHLFSQGHEIAGHSRTHRDLATLSTAEQQSELQGCRHDLLAMNVGPVLSFAYPFGSYTGTTLQLVKDAGYRSGRAIIHGRVRPTTDHYQLRRCGVEVSTTFAQVQHAIDKAVAAKQWLILGFHQIIDSAERYTTSPAVFHQMVDYLAQQHIPVVMVSQGMRSMSPRHHAHYGAI